MRDEIENALRSTYVGLEELLQRESFSVLQCAQPDGSTLLITAGLADRNGGVANRFEYCMHVDGAVDELFDLLVFLAEGVGDILFPVESIWDTAGLAGCPPVFDAVSLMYGGGLSLEGRPVALRQLVGLTRDEKYVAYRQSIYTIEAAWNREGIGRRCRVGRETTPFLEEAEQRSAFSSLRRGARDVGLRVIKACENADDDAAESLRGRFGKAQAAKLTAGIGPLLAHPAQVATLLHVMMDFPIEELRAPCLRLLQVHPQDPSAPQWYADALGLLGAIDGGSWGEAYDRFRSDFELAIREAERRRAEAGLELAYSLIPNPLWARRRV